MLHTDWGYLDLYDHIPGFSTIHVREVFTDCETSDGIRLISLRWLRRLKQAAARHKDLDDLENLPAA
jgi:hypothetical protein